MPGAPPDLLCPFILPLRRPVVPLMVGGKWNKGLLLAPYPGLSLLPNPKPTAPTNLHRFVFRGTHHASVMPVIHFLPEPFSMLPGRFLLTPGKVAFSSSFENGIFKSGQQTPVVTNKHALSEQHKDTLQWARCANCGQHHRAWKF